MDHLFIVIVPAIVIFSALISILFNKIEALRKQNKSTQDALRAFANVVGGNVERYWDGTVGFDTVSRHDGNRRPVPMELFEKFRDDSDKATRALFKHLNLDMHITHTPPQPAKVEFEIIKIGENNDRTGKNRTRVA